MKRKRIAALLLAGVFVVSTFSGCSIFKKNYTLVNQETKTVIDMTMFAAMFGTELNDGNEIQEEIAQRTGVRLKEYWLTGQTTNDAISSIIASGDLPDFIDGGDGSKQLYDNGLLVAWDDYLERYPNLKEMYTPKEWDNFRQDDGHIYWANVFCNTYGDYKTTGHNDEAFWIQARVLEEEGYPVIETLDDYFNVLESYYSKHPTFTTPEGEEVDIIPYTCLCDDWRYFSIENAPAFLDGYPNDGTIVVNTTDYDVPTVELYDNTPTAKRYLAKLNEEYNKGIVDKDFYLQLYEDYLEKLSTGAVLGMCDQYWNFNYSISGVFKENGLAELGCDYVPLGLTIDPGMTQQWHSYGDSLNSSSGVAVTTKCEDPELAFSFLNDVLSQEIHDLRFWGIKDVDYLVGADGLYYRTDEMRENWDDAAYRANHVCQYSYLPQWLGTSRDGVNAMQPQEQPSEFLASLSTPLANCFKAYNAGGYVEMIGSEKKEPEVWFPLYSYSLNLSEEAGKAYKLMGETKHEWLPKVVIASDFEAAWNDYMAAYDACNPQDYVTEMQDQLDRKIAYAAAN